MSDERGTDQRFGEIAVAGKFVSLQDLTRALRVQIAAYERTKVHLPIGRVMVSMGLLTKDQVTAILNGTAPAAPENPGAPSDAETPVPPKESVCPGLNLVVSDDMLTAHVVPSDGLVSGASLEALKGLLSEDEITHGIVSDDELAAYLATEPLPEEPFLVAAGTPSVPGDPEEIKYFFDTDPLRVGTLKEGGIMDWKDRGELPQVKAGDRLAERVGGSPGEPGMDIYGRTVSPPRVKSPTLKCGKGVRRSEDGMQILAKIDGMPKLTPDGKVHVLAQFSVREDIGLETGHVDYDGLIEVPGTICSGYRVRGKELKAQEIQSATVEIEENLAVYGGIYGATITVGGNLKASHIHNSTIHVKGDLLVEREILDCTIEVGGRCLITGGNILASTISAKKGVHAQDIGAPASRPSRLTLGVDFQLIRDLKGLKEALSQLRRRKSTIEESIQSLKAHSDALNTDLGEVAQKQDHQMLQQRKLEEKLQTPEVTANPDMFNTIKKAALQLADMNRELDEKVAAIMAEDDQTVALANEKTDELQKVSLEMDEVSERLALIKDTVAMDPGVPVAKVIGTIYEKTEIITPHAQLSVPEMKNHVRIAEVAGESGCLRRSIQISPLR